MPSGTKPLLDSVTWQQRCSIGFIWEQFHKKCSWTYSTSKSVTCVHIVLASHPCTCVLHRQLSQLHTLKLPEFFHFHGDFHQKWHFAHPKISFAHPELPFLAKSMCVHYFFNITTTSPRGQWVNSVLQCFKLKFSFSCPENGRNVHHCSENFSPHIIYCNFYLLRVKFY